MAAHKENHISSEWLKGGMRSQISVYNYVNQTPMKTNKRSDHIVIKHINVQSLIQKLDEIKLLIENEDLDILCISKIWLQPNIPDDLISIKNTMFSEMTTLLILLEVGHVYMSRTSLPVKHMRTLK